MSDPLDACIQQINPEYLTELVRCTLDRPGAKIKDWQCQPIHGGFELTNAIIRCQGNAEDNGQLLPWSLVAKITRADESNNNPDGIWYWKREALAYQSGFFKRMPPGLTAPRCYGVEEKDDGSVWIWMEDVKDDFDHEWSLETYTNVARQLAKFNAAYLTGTPLPNEAWMARDWLRMYVEHSAPTIQFMRDNPKHPVIDKLFSTSLHYTLGMWETRKLLLDSLDKQPQVYCHQDAFRRNLFVRQGELVGIDWGYSGIAPIGAELASLIAVSIGLGNMPSEKIFELEKVCIEGYLLGLKDAGLDINPGMIRRNYFLTVCLRYVLGASIGEMVPALLDDAMRERVKKALDTSKGETIETFSSSDQVTQYYLAVFMQALKVMGLRPLLKDISSTIRIAQEMKRKHGWKIPPLTPG
jgi:hypothetical protein